MWLCSHFRSSDFLRCSLALLLLEALYYRLVSNIIISNSPGENSKPFLAFPHISVASPSLFRQMLCGSTEPTKPWVWLRTAHPSCPVLFMCIQALCSCKILTTCQEGLPIFLQNVTPLPPQSAVSVHFTSLWTFCECCDPCRSHASPVGSEDKTHS